MQCPRCGADIPSPEVPYCPRCGQALTGGAADPRRAAPSGPSRAPSVPEYSEGGAAGAWPGAGGGANSPDVPGPQADAPGQPWSAGPAQSYGGYGGYGGAAPPSGYGGYGGVAPPSGYGMPPGAYGPPPYGPPSYGQAPLPGSPAYPPPYSMGSPMSVPLTTPPGGAPMYPPPYPQQPPYWAPPPPRKSNIGLIVGIVVAAVLVICVAGVGVLYAIGNSQAGNTGAQSPGVSATQTPSATSTRTPLSIAYQNSLTTGSSGWPNDQHCFPGSDGYHIKDGYICYAPAGDQSNVDVTVTVSQASGSTNEGYGISIRRTAQIGNGYDFVIYGDSNWAFFKCVQHSCARVVDFTPNAAIAGGLNARNTVRVHAVGSHFDFYVNGKQVGQADDTTYSTGLVGLAGASGTGSECIFQNLTISRAG